MNKLLLVLTVLGLNGAALWVSPAKAADAIELSPGTLLDAAGNHAYVADPAGYLHAVRLNDGQSAWVSTERALPLAMLQDQLVALGSVEQFGLGVLLLIKPASGQVADRIAFDLPESVSAEISGKPNRIFTTRTEVSTNGLRIHWNYQSQPLRGALLEAADDDATNDPEVLEFAGTLELRLDQAGNYLLPLRYAAPPPAQRDPELASNERLQILPDRQFRSADDQALLHSTAKVDDTFGTIYRWEVYDRQSRRQLGGLDSHYALTQFRVIGDVLIYQAPAQELRNASGEWDASETRLVAYDLRQSRELWSFNILDRNYRGPMPP